MKRTFLRTALSCVVAASAFAGVGDTAIDFTKITVDHGIFTLSAQKGKVVYLYFAGYS